jgi:pyruvate dehydrogenase E1 component alpha subunit
MSAQRSGSNDEPHSDHHPKRDRRSNHSDRSNQQNRPNRPAPRQVLDDEGRVLPDATEPDLTGEELLEMYEYLVLARRFDERAVSLQRQGRLATYAPMGGQEAAQVGSAFALDDADWTYPTYREHAAKLVRGLDVERVFLALRGHGEGDATPEGYNVMPEYIPISTQIPQAVGAAWATKLKGGTAATLCYFGDGATSEGDFHEGLNFAGVFDTPNVFFCNNNGWAISVPRGRQTASATIAEKAKAYGFEGVRVDGMDPLAVYQVTKEAVEKTKNPDEDELRPTLIEAVQYRFGAHTTADDTDRYRDGVPEKWLAKDPLPRMEAFLRETGRLDDEAAEALSASVETRIDEAIAAAEAAPRPEPDKVFEHVHAEPTPQLRRQRASLDDLRDAHGEAAFESDR